MLIYVLSPLLILGASSGAGPTSLGVAVVATDRCESGLLAGSAATVREAVTLRLGQQVQTEEESIRLLGGAARGSLSDVSRVVSAARQDLYQGAWPKAQRSLELALGDVESLPPAEERWAMHKEVLAMLAQVFRASGKTGEAESILEQIVRVDPGHRPDSGIYPPSFIAMYDGVRDRVGKVQRVSLTVETRPSGLPVFVGGRSAGVSPLKLKLPPGGYAVETVFGPRRGLPLKVRLEADTLVTMDEAFEGIVWPNAGPCIATPVDRATRLDTLARIGAILGVESVVGVREERLAGEERMIVASLVEVGSGQELREGRIRYVTSRPGNEALQRLADFISTGTARPPVEATLFASNSSGTRSRVLRWAGYALGAAGVGLLGGSGAMHYRASDTATQRDALIVGGVVPTEHRKRFTALHTQSEEQRRLGWGLAAGGLALTGGAVALYLVSGSPQSAPPVVPVVGPNAVGVAGSF